MPFAVKLAVAAVPLLAALLVTSLGSGPTTEKTDETTVIQAHGSWWPYDRPRA